MKLLLIRHAAAMPRGTPGVPDDERPLTPDGKAKFRVAARGLARVTRRPDLLLTSPLPRARATAEIAARAFAVGLAATEDEIPHDKDPENSRRKNDPLQPIQHGEKLPND